MTKHETTIDEADGRWYPKCRCGWGMISAIRTGDAVANNGYFGRPTEAEARALADKHLARHGKEHNENPACVKAPVCTPVADTVPVPVSGTVLVVNGVVQDIADVETEECLHYRQLGPGTSYFLYVPKPKPDDFAIGDRVRVDSPGMAGTATVTAVGVKYLLVIDQLNRQERSVAKLYCRKMEAT